MTSIQSAIHKEDIVSLISNPINKSIVFNLPQGDIFFIYALQSPIHLFATLNGYIYHAKIAFKNRKLYLVEVNNISDDFSNSDKEFFKSFILANVAQLIKHYITTFVYGETSSPDLILTA